MASKRKQIRPYSVFFRLKCKASGATEPVSYFKRRRHLIIQNTLEAQREITCNEQQDADVHHTTSDEKQENLIENGPSESVELAVRLEEIRRKSGISTKYFDDLFNTLYDFGTWHMINTGLV